MFVTYKPEAGDRQEWIWDPNRIRATEGQVLLREFGQNSWDLFVQAVKVNDLHARRILLWHLSRRDHPFMKFADTPDFYAAEMTVEFSSADLVEMLDSVKASGQAKLPADKQQMIEAFESEIEAALKREANAGKAPAEPISSTESTTTG